MHRTVYTVQKATFCTEVYMGLPVTGWTPDAVRTAIKIQSTFQRLRASCLLLYSYSSNEIILFNMPLKLRLCQLYGN